MARVTSGALHGRAVPLGRCVAPTWASPLCAGSRRSPSPGPAASPLGRPRGCAEDPPPSCADFYIPGDWALVRDWVRSCVMCQRNKIEILRPAGLLRPLEVPSQVWVDISLDFIKGLPKVGGKSVILTVVNRFSKYSHFIALNHPYMTASVARAFFDGIVYLHGFPASIVSDRDPVFTSHVWRDLFHLAGVKLRLSTAFHPQTDGQSKVVIRVIAMYLRCVTGDRPRAWVDWLAWAEYCYNTSYNSALHATSFEVVYGRPPPPILPVDPETARHATCFAAGTRCLHRCANAFSRLSRCQSATTMIITVTQSLWWATGCGYASFTAPHSPWTRALSAS
ncbi:Alpha-L-fucosidase 2 [Hordeum vulgare]|nr:Alpha-L-fucosidase 2 [Hordeum vulgare]